MGRKIFAVDRSKGPCQKAVDSRFLEDGWLWLIEVLQVKYLNNIIEQDHRFIKKLTQQMKGFKHFSAAVATLEGIEVAHMISKR